MPQIPQHARIFAMLLLHAATLGAAEEPCLSDTVYARLEAQVIRNQFTDPDPASRTRLGLPQAIESITWRRESPICAQALRNLRVVGDSLGWAEYPIGGTTMVYVFDVEPDLYVVVGDGNLNMLSFFTRQWRYIVTVALAS